MCSWCCIRRRAFSCFTRLSHRWKNQFQEFTKSLFFRLTFAITSGSSSLGTVPGTRLWVNEIDCLMVDLEKLWMDWSLFESMWEDTSLSFVITLPYPLLLDLCLVGCWEFNTELDPTNNGALGGRRAEYLFAVASSLLLKVCIDGEILDWYGLKWMLPWCFWTIRCIHCRYWNLNCLRYGWQERDIWFLGSLTSYSLDRFGARRLRLSFSMLCFERTFSSITLMGFLTWNIAISTYPA